MLLTLSMVLVVELLLVWRLAKAMRLFPERISFVEAFLLGHFPFLIAGLLFATERPSNETGRYWHLALLLPLVSLGSIAGATVVRGFVRSRPAPDVVDAEKHPGDIRRTVLTCMILSAISLFALMYQPIPLLERITMPRYQRYVSTRDATSFGEIAVIVNVAVLVLVASLVVRRHRRRVWLYLALVIALGVMLAGRLADLSRGPVLQLAVGFAVITWYWAKRWRRAVIVGVATIGVAALPFSIALGIYRSSLDWGEVYDAFAGGDWVQHAMVSDHSIATVDICTGCLREFDFPDHSLGVDGVLPLVFFFVPRTVWPAKPPVFGQVVWQEVLGGGSEVLGVGPTFIGESYAIAGEAGTLIMAFVVGVALVLLEYLCFRYLPPWDALGLTACLLFQAAAIARGDFRSAFILFFVEFPVLYFIAFQVSGILLALLGKGARFALPR